MEKNEKRYLSIILLLALFVRLATALWLGDTMEVLPAGGTHDQVSYDALALRVATGHGFTFPVAWYPWIPPDTPTSYYSGAMVLHLAAIYYIFGYHPLIPRILYAVLGTFICYFVYLLGKRIFGTKVGLIAAGLASGYAYLILYSATLLTETPFIFFLLSTLLSAYKLKDAVTTKRLLLFGVSLAGALLFRMAVLPFFVFLFAWLLFPYSRSSNHFRFKHVLLPVVIIFLAVFPWTVRNYLLYNRFMLLESQFGHVFWNSNHPDRGYTFGDVDWVAPIPEELKSLNEAELTTELLRRGIENVFQDPMRYISLTISRAPIFFAFWPTNDSSLASNVSRVMSFGITLPFMIYGFLLSGRRKYQCFPLYVFIVMHYGVYLASWVMIRYRIPADAVALPFAALALDTLISHIHVRTFTRSHV